MAQLEGLTELREGIRLRSYGTKKSNSRIINRSFDVYNEMYRCQLKRW